MNKTLNILNCEVYAQRLRDPGVDIKVKVAIVTEIRDSIEFVQSVEYPRFLAYLIPAFNELLMREPPVFVSNMMEQKLRNLILEILHRFPQNEALRSFAQDLTKTLMHLLRVDNEENACVCLKIIVDLHKNYKSALEEWVQPFFDVVQDMYKNLDQAVKETFDDPAVGTPASTTSAHVPASPATDGESTGNKVLLRSLYSFKVLTECPIIIALLFQLHRKFVSANVPVFVPLIIKALQLQPEPQRQALLEANASGRAYVGMSAAIRNKVAYSDFKALQVKTVSFIAYILRSFVATLKPHQDAIADAVVNLMRDCPSDAAATRKELLVATRHIWYTEFRTAFINHVDVLLNEDVLIGTGVTARETLRPLAHSVLVDLIHHVRNDLTASQLARTIHMNSCNLHDPNFSLNLQTMCVRLLLNLVDCLANPKNTEQLDRETGRRLLLRILDAFTTKLASLQVTLPMMVKYHQRRKTLTFSATDTPALETEFDGFLDLGYVQPIGTAVKAHEGSQDVVKDSRFLVKCMLQGVKSIVMALSRCNPVPAPAGTNGDRDMIARGFSQSEVEILKRFLRESLGCVHYFSNDHFGPEGLAGKSPPTMGKEEKDCLDAIAATFVHIEPAAFQEVFTSQVSFVFDQFLANPTTMTIAQQILNNAAVSPNFMGILLRHLVDRLEKLGSETASNATVTLKLFKLVFLAVTGNPDKNENVLRPHLATIIMTSIKMSAKAKEPLHYFLLLRQLFRSIGGGRFEMLYQDVLPLLQALLEALNTLLNAAHKPYMREIFVELCLTVPVRLSVLLPYLSWLMKPLVFALQGGPDLVSQGLRTLELCIDNLTQEFLEPIMEPVRKDLMAALWKHLRPAPYNGSHSHNTMRILGKLGGRNRKLMKEPTDIRHKLNMESGLDVSILFHGHDRHQTLSLDRILDLVLQILEAPQLTLFYREQAFHFAKAALPLLLDVDEGGDEFTEVLQQAWRKYFDELAPSKDAPAEADAMQGVEGAAANEAGGGASGSQSEGDSGSASTNTQGTATSNEGTPFIDTPVVNCDKKEALDAALSKVMAALFAASNNTELKDQAWPLVEHLCRHFAILTLNESIAKKKIITSRAASVGRTMTASDVAASNPASRIDGFIDAIVNVMTSEELAQRKLGEKAMLLFYNTLLSLLGGKRQGLDNLPVFHTFAMRFCSCCYQQEWFRKTGGCIGISILTAQFELGTKWTLSHELDFAKALLFVLKDTSPDMATTNIEDATQTLAYVLKVCNRPEDDGEAEERKAKFTSLISLLIAELSNSNPAVRDTIQSSFQLLADLTGREVTEILTPVRDRFLTPIYTKPLRALPFTMQIAHIDAITYCLSLRPPLLTFNDELIRMLHEALALADAEDQALVSKTSQYKNATLLINLRIVCIKLLSCAMQCPDFSHPRQSAMKARVIAVFFKSLYSKSQEVVDVANKGLQQVLQAHPKLPKDLLQAGLRPILVNLSDHKRLTVAGLEGLARLLGLLQSYFKVEIGKKLLDHLRLWTDPVALTEMAGKPLSEVEEIKIVVAILNVFHLLPPTANIFMEELVKEILELERRLSRGVSSPFRKPLVKFLNKYAVDAVTFFFERLHDAGPADLLIDILADEDAEVFRLEVIKNIDKLVEKTLNVNEEDVNRDALHMRGARAIERLCRYQPEWIIQQRAIVGRLLQIWQQMQKTTPLLDPGVEVPGRNSEFILQILIGYCKREPGEIELLFDMIEGFRQENLIDKGFLKQFYFENVAERSTGPQKKAILEHFLSIFPKPEVMQESKTLMIRMMIVPMLLLSFSKGEHLDIVDSKIIELIHANIWAPLVSEAGEAQVTEDALKVELLQFTTLLVQYVPQAINETRKDVIKFAWNHLKVEDITCKQAAYVLLARFIQEYETPSKIVIQIYVALLKSHQLEGKALVRQALDILVPVLPKRVPHTAADLKAGGVSTWVRWTRKIIVEDGHALTQLLTVYQVLVRHADLFYDSRDHFIPQIVTSLPKLGLSTNATPDRALTLDLCELIIKWETKHVEETKAAESGNAENEDIPAGGKRKVGPDEATSPTKRLHAEGEAKQEFATPKIEAQDGRDSVGGINYKELMTNYVIRFACTLTDPTQKRGMAFRTLSLMRSMLQLWPDINVKLNQFERAAAMEVGEATINTICNAIELLAVVIDSKSGSWIVSNIGTLKALIEKWINTDNPRIIRSLSPLLTRVFHATAEAQEDEGENSVAELSAFSKLVDSVITSGLKEMVNSHSVIHLLSAAYAHRPEGLQPFLPDMMRLLQKLFTEERARIAAGPQQPVAAPPTESPASLLIKLLQLLKLRVSQMGDQRKTFLQCLMLLLEPTSDSELLRSIMHMVGDWVRNGTEAFPTIKEKANLMTKMMCFENCRDVSLVEEYLELVADIYSDPSFARSELTVRLENAFLMGTKYPNPPVRRRFLDIFHRSIGQSLYVRMTYILGVQNWEYLSNFFWIRQAIDLLVGSIVDTEYVHTCAPGFRVLPVTSVQLGEMMPNTLDEMAVDGGENGTNVAEILGQHRDFLRGLQSLQLSSLLEPLRNLLYVDNRTAAAFWANLLPLGWNLINNRERHDMVKVIIPLLAKEYHAKQMDARPNVIQALLEGFTKCFPPIQLPPQLVKYLAKSYKGWYTGLELLHNASLETKSTGIVLTKEEDSIRESTLDALAEIFQTLGEDDYYFGLWRRRCAYAETNAAISFEQNGLWAQAQTLYEAAQHKARTGVLPFNESEYALWEKHWMICAQRLQQWDILLDLARHENDPELLLECAWRGSDWIGDRDQLQKLVEQLPDRQNPRKKVFEAFMLLLRLQDAPDKGVEFLRTLDEGVQVALKKWYMLPDRVVNAHLGLLHNFQQWVEFKEAGEMQQNLIGTNASNLDQKTQELKGTLQTWRERLPNTWDDINLWSDLVHWRQQVFQTINKSYLPLVPQLSSQGHGSQSPTSSNAYQGYHQTAWIINRFAHVARKHGLPDVCINSLSKIYTLPNIEIQEAFYKLREQAKCHLQSPNEYAAGLDVINNTNLMYFSMSQKAEFFALKGIFFAKLNLHDDVTASFSSAIHMEASLAKAWAAWGQYSDRMFKDHPKDMRYGSEAVNCYLQAAGIYNSAKSRKYLARLLWLLSLDDAHGTLMKAHDQSRAEMPLWYWITFIPQLLAALAHKEARYARNILMKLAKSFPQAMHFQLRTAKEDFLVLKKQAVASTSAARSAEPPAGAPDSPQVPQQTDDSSSQEGAGAGQPNPALQTPASATRRQPWEYVEEVMALLKTAFPLLALTMETMVDQILQRLKPTTDEDIYRLIVALLNDGVQMYLQQIARDPSDGGALSQATEMNLQRFAESMQPNHLKYKAAFERDFIKSKPTLAQLVDKFRDWRDKLEVLLDHRPRKQHLEHFSHYLVEFEYQKFEEIEVPGQYFLLRDSSRTFVKIERFHPEVDVLRGHGWCHRRLTIRGQNGSLHPFIVQHPAPRHCRREERIVQLFRILNSTLERRKETRRRNLMFQLPIIVPLAPQIRLLQDDPTYVSLQEVYEDHCSKAGAHKDDPIIFYTNRLREMFISEEISRRGVEKMEVLNMKTEIMEEIAAKLVPETILSRYMIRCLESYSDLWLMRKQFTQSMATATFITHLFSVGQRQPHKFQISRKTGNVWTSDLLPVISNTTFLFTNSEAVPFRFTPNIQHFMTPIGIEGVFTSSLMAVARALSEPQSELDDYLNIFVRDELISWQSISRKPALAEHQLREFVGQNVDLLLKRAQAISCKAEREKGIEKPEPVNQTILDLISMAANPTKLAQMEVGFLPQL